MLDKAHQDLEEETMKWKKISTELPSTYGEVKQEPPERRCQHGLFRELLHSQFLSSVLVMHIQWIYNEIVTRPSHSLIAMLIDT
jgi:hypothetical protein